VAEPGHDPDREQDAGDRQQDVDDAHQDAVDLAARAAGDGADVVPPISPKKTATTPTVRLIRAP
jgi:hypothetical protein